MRTVTASLVITIFSLTGCDRNQLKADNDQLRTQLSEVQSRLAASEDRASKAEAALREVKMFANQIDEISLELTLSCTKIDGDVSVDPAIPPLGSRIVLASASEQFQFTSNVDAPPEIRSTSPGVYELTLSYRPLSEAHFVDKDINALAAITQLKASYGDLLSAVGMQLRGVETVKVYVNGLLVLNATSLGVPQDGGSDLDHLNVSSHFASVPSNYAQATTQWARNHGQ